MPVFKHELGARAKSEVLDLHGVITARSENLYGCNRYYIQPKAGADMKVPDGFWVDEEDVIVMSQAVQKPAHNNGGPVSTKC